jgi:hypothetical protein
MDQASIRSWCGSFLSGIGLMFGLVACASPRPVAQPISPQLILLEPGQSIRVEANIGTINVRGTPDPFLSIAGTMQVPDWTEYTLVNGADEIQISAALGLAHASNPRNEAIVLELTVPDGADLSIDTDQADVNLSDAAGSIRVNSVAGNVVAQTLEGDFYLRSGRGDVQAADITGRLSVVSEHGTVTIMNASGTISSNNIMGPIHFTGMPGRGDDVHFETDHGAVMVDLGSQAGLELSARSTSGLVTCRLPQLPQTVWGCAGTLGDGSGRLTIRTVSGPVTIQRIP